jgi:DNA-binding transcriptional ArsR family regulator
MEEEKEYHRRYLRAVNHPLRKTILRLLLKQDMTTEQLAEKLKKDVNSLLWHLTFLEYGHCITHKRDNGRVVYMLTKEGNVINYLEESLN